MEWISVEDRLPDRDVSVLTVGEDGFHVSFQGSRSKDITPDWVREGDDYNFCVFGVTHWMTLPPPPNG